MRTPTTSEPPWIEEKWAAGVQQSLLNWWPGNTRNLPWRELRDPWPVLVSEVMSQQTQVERVIPRWVAFLERFPTAAEASSAPLSEILGLWSGLGYNSRGKRLQDAAKAIERLHGGRVPERLEDLVALPGIGPYTARAVQAFAYELDVGVVDTNVGRVLARLFGRSLNAKDAQLAATELVPVGQGWRWNQALLDLGSMVCRKSRPHCADCPLRLHCTFAQSTEMADPALGSFAVSKPQAAFEGSNRQGRGRLMKALLDARVSEIELADVMGWAGDDQRARRVVAGLVDEDLVELVDGYYQLREATD